MKFAALFKLKNTNFQVYFTLSDQRPHCDFDEEVLEKTLSDCSNSSNANYHSLTCTLYTHSQMKFGSDKKHYVLSETRTNIHSDRFTQCTMWVCDKNRKSANPIIKCSFLSLVTCAKLLLHEISGFLLR